MSRSCSVERLSTGLSSFTMTAIPSCAITIGVRPRSCSSALSPRDELAMSAVPLLTASIPAEEPRPETSTSMPVSSLKPSAAISAMGRQVVEPATVIEDVEDPEEQAHSVSVSTAALRTDPIFLIASRRSLHGARRCHPRCGRNKSGRSDERWKVRCPQCRSHRHRHPPASREWRRKDRAYGNR